ncbi:hypothetical protein E3P92_01272 [Wallemia ichthyophaga]|uniref:Heat shock protein n=1 Tax=Wallemia ichthyophaga (strain EXF-994 / CBS 113033) TaxID=1299270 RepID=R9AL92_WALI9|nr:Heat shock protein [Wallemia ichthyophaga EXF-994]TIA74393.1 hypothetical protein E3P91_00980 [Wallemia ichthyophaga]EOR00811.1 Heat shock protein [Wallemia ichthyophaga EXF-994]TIA82908.1 hypothetical protein E3P98_01063 [Wallemia ichthyophaga]TIA92836.1 hypothetical protein E3P97_01286 [Wallemia ichthyophaga]TIA96976.1 hypothetical protein E3P95_03037 [Wallemia ichthyophaga]
MSSSNFTDRSRESITLAIQLARENNNALIYPAHIASILLNDPTRPEGAAPSLFATALERAGVDKQSANRELQKLIVKIPVQDPPPDDITLSTAAGKIIRRAEEVMKNQHDSFVAQDHLIIALLEDSAILQALKNVGLSSTKTVENALNQQRGGRRVDRPNAEDGFDALNKYATDLTAEAESGRLDPVIGRDNEIRRVIRVLCRRTKSNPVLIGEPGVGKTAVVEGLAQRIVNRDVPASLLGKLFSLDAGALMAGAKYKGEYEERVKSVLDEIEKLGDQGNPVILFCDEIHLLMAGSGDSSGGMDAANLFKPMLARGKIRLIGATTLNEFRQHIEKDAAFERRLQQVMVNEPSVNESITILRGISHKLEVHHGVRILDSALVAASTLARRYLTGRKLPDAAIDLIDEACAGVRVARETVPEQVDQLERSKLQLEVAIHALSRESDKESKANLEEARKSVAAIDEELKPMKAAHEASKFRDEEINEARRKVEDLTSKADAAERRYDLATSSDIRFYAIPDLQKKIEQMEQKKNEDEAAEGQETSIVTPDQIGEVVARWTGVPATRIQTTEKEKLLRLEKLLSKNVVGQPEAVKSVANAIRLSRSGLSNAQRPIASFLFCGPSGTGKTLLSKQLAQLLFDSEQAMMRIDSSEFSEKHSISRLIGAPPGYVGHGEGGQLTEYVRRKPYSVILIDEIEKACREFIVLLLQILDEGRCTDGQGRTVNFNNCVLIMTSNLGASHLAELAGDDGGAPTEAKGLVMGAVQGHFPPEFINRIDEIIIFRNLALGDVRRIVDIRLDEIQKRMKANGKNIKMIVDEAAKHYLASVGFNPIYGARPLNRSIQQEILTPLSSLILAERVLDGESVEISFDPPRNRLFVKPNHEGVVDMDEDDDDDDYDDDVEIEELQ